MKSTFFSCIAMVSVLAGCGSGGGSGSSDPGVANMATFDVEGSWTGTAMDDATKIDVTLILDNNGGDYGMHLAGELRLKGIGEFPFEEGFIDPSAGPSRVAEIIAVDDKGFKYTLRGEFTSKRFDGGQFDSTNPAALPAGRVFLETTLTKEE